MTSNVCIDGITVSDASSNICVDGSTATVCVDGVTAYSVASGTPPNISTSSSLHALNDNDGTSTEAINVAITSWVPTSTGGAITSFSIVAGALPSGLSLDPATGSISGTPTTEGAFSWTVRATNASGTSNFNDAITVVEAPNIASSASIGNMTSGVAISAYNSTNTGSAATSYSLPSGALPNGLGLNGITGEITGTPTVEGAFSWTLRATNKAGSSDFADTSTVAAPVAAPNITTSQSLDAANDNDGDILNGIAISPWLPTSTGGPITAYSISAGALPAGLAINSGTGEITGTPTVDGTYNWTVTATGAGGTSAFIDAVDVNSRASVSFNPSFIGDLGQFGAGGSTGFTVGNTGAFSKLAGSPPDFIGNANGTWRGDSPVLDSANYEVFYDTSGVEAEFNVSEQGATGQTNGFVTITNSAIGFTLTAKDTSTAFSSSGTVLITIREIANPANSQTLSLGASYTF